MIEVGTNSIVVRNIEETSQEFKNARFRFSLYDNVTHKYTLSAFKQIGKDLYFPASIGITEIQSCFPKEEVMVNLLNFAKTKKILFNIKNKPKDELQEASVRFLAGMQNDKFCHSRFLQLVTGSGKTYVTINISSKFKRRTMIIVDTLDLAAQWKREFLKHSDITEDSIRILSGADSVEKESKAKDGKVFIAIHRTLTDLIEKDDNSINELMNKLGIGLRVFDEAHVNFKNICLINSLSNVEYTLYLTATPGRSKFTDDFLYGKVFRGIPYFNGKEMTQENYHTVILHKIDSKPPLDISAGIKTKYGFSGSRWANYISEDAYEIFLLDVNFLFTKLNLVDRKKKVAIMLPTIALIKKLKLDLEIMFPGVEIGEFIGEIPKDKRLQELDKQIILTNDKIFDKGIDVKDLEVLINYVQLGSIIKIEQIMGRLRYGKDKSSILIDVTDSGFEECTKQFKLRRRFYKKKAKKIIEIL